MPLETMSSSSARSWRNKLIGTKLILTWTCLILDRAAAVNVTVVVGKDKFVYDGGTPVLFVEATVVAMFT